MEKDEGYIKYQAIWEERPPFSTGILHELVQWRQHFYAQNLIGVYPDGIGFGNISQRASDGKTFHISGSATGKHAKVSNAHFSRVDRVEASSNMLWCSGPVIASSESMSHAVIYEQLPWVQAVLHGHDLALWQELLHQVPTTDARAAYGSPEMVASIAQLIKETNLPDEQLFVMEGHREGLFIFGRTFTEVATIVDKLFERRIQDIKSKNY